MSWRPLSRDREPAPLRTGIERTLRHLRAPSVDSTRALFERWPELIGPEMAAHVTPVSIDDGELVVTTADAAWASQLRWLSTELADRINRGLDEDAVASIVVRVRGR